MPDYKETKRGCSVLGVRNSRWSLTACFAKMVSLWIVMMMTLCR